MSNPGDRELIVFSAARRLPVHARAAYLGEACAGDKALRQRVEGLLRASEDAGGFLQEPAPGAQRPVDPIASPNPLPNAAAPGENVGDRIGRYKLLQQIGEGGCGVVYMAEQEESVRRRVAVKVPLGAAFTYQGRLDLNGQPANGTFYMFFTEDRVAAEWPTARV